MTTFHIYGRKAYETPLTFVGEVEIEDVAELKTAAFEAFGGDDWVELVGIPAEAWIYVTQKETATV